MTKAELYQKACMLPLLPGVYIIASLDMLWSKSSRVRPSSLLPMLFELEVLLTWAREPRLEYEVGS